MTFLFDRCIAPRLARMIEAYEPVHKVRYLDGPFDKPKIRQAAFAAFNQRDFLQAVIGMSATYSGEVLIPLMLGAMGGSIVAANRTDRPGAVFTITMPVPKSAAHLGTAA